MHPRIFGTAVALAAALSTPVVLYAATDDAPDAEALYQQNCTSCHGAEVYTRPDRKIDSLDALKTQVRMCEQNLNLTWFDDQIDSVAGLLNQRYYKFGD
jgi:mono/diheme cytochrome c family protein